LNDVYSLALAQALQRHARDAAETLTEIKRLDPSNPNALLGLGVVELYRFRPGQAQMALDQAAKISPDNSTLRTLRIVASALRLDLPKTLHLLRS
jgi:cytochrome c-type biogenesis protein CcmH/NrfG